MDERLISPKYAELNAELHQLSDGYGSSAGARWGVDVANLLRDVGAATVIDYGCGKGSLREVLKELYPYARVREYDPGVPGKERVPRAPADVVVCTDVLEHVEEGKINAVLDHVANLTEKAFFGTVCTRPASEHKLLADGRNPHQTVRPLSWWVRRFQKRFSDVDYRSLPEGEHVIVARKGDSG